MTLSVYSSFGFLRNENVYSVGLTDLIEGGQSGVCYSIIADNVFESNRISNEAVTITAEDKDQVIAINQRTGSSVSVVLKQTSKIEELISSSQRELLITDAQVEGVEVVFASVGVVGVEIGNHIISGSTDCSVA